MDDRGLWLRPQLIAPVMLELLASPNERRLHPDRM